MHEGISKLLETLAKKGRDKVIADASAVLRREAELRFPTLHYHQDRIYALKGFLKWSGRRVRSIYNKEDGVSLRGDEALRIEELKQAQELRKSGEANRDVFAALQERIARLEGIVLAFEAAQNHQALADESNRTFRRRRTDVASATHATD